MKRWLSLLLIAALTLTALLAGCTNHRDEEDSSSEPDESSVSEPEPEPEPEPDAEDPSEPDIPPEPAPHPDLEPAIQPVTPHTGGSSQAAAPSAPAREETGVELLCEQGSYPVGTETIKVVMFNHTASEGSADMYYTIDRYDGAEWVPVALDYEFIDIGVILGAWDSWESTVSLQPSVYSYQPGAYRVRKIAWAGNTRYDLTAPFTLE